ncbi:MAG: UDP-N-acetylmuramate dehydrogenase, partial [Candidatus Omnitrophota bacterium]
VKYKRDEILAKHTTFRIGGPAQYWVEPRDVAQLAELMCWCKKNRMRVRVIGAGSNILAADQGVRGIVVRLSASYFTSIRSINRLCLAGAGALLSSLIAYCTQQGLSGVEFLTGIPGTVGGALAGNAGTKDKSIGDLVEFVIVMDYNGDIRKRSAADLDFSYRRSNLGDCVVLQACLKLVKKDKTKIRSSIVRYVDARRRSQGKGWFSAGCCFKNPAGDSAGRLIDACGLKGARSGNAVVSEAHANFILNDGNAKASDVLALMRRIKAKVKKRFGARLEPEIKIWR